MPACPGAGCLPSIPRVPFPAGSASCRFLPPLSPFTASSPPCCPAASLALRAGRLPVALPSAS
eukprot:1860206-Alexandrium_andersonii.AAC.1